MVGTLAALLSIFPTGFQSLGNVMVPNSSFYAYRGEVYPHRELIDHVAQTQPYQLSNIGGLQSTAEFQQHNVSYYGKRPITRCTDGKLAVGPSQHDKDLESCSWFYAQGPQDQPWPPEGEDTQSELARNAGCQGKSLA